MTAPTPEQMRALAEQHASAAHREQFGGDKCWYENTAAALRAAADQLDAVRRYAEDRSYHAGRRNNTVHSWRIASDLLGILSVAPSSRADRDG